MKDKKVPLFCRIRKHIVIPSPSASIFCGLGLRNRPKCLCKNCPKKVIFNMDWGICKEE